MEQKRVRTLLVMLDTPVVTASPDPTASPRWRRSIGRSYRAQRWAFAITMATALVLVLNSGAAVALDLAQPGSGDEAATLARKQWWDLDRARSCGRLQCSQVVSPSIPLGPGEPRITVAVRAPDGTGGGAGAALVEARATAVATSLKRIAARQEALVEPGSTPLSPRGLRFWLDRSGKPRHPLTPSLAIGVKNRSPVIYLPSDAGENTPQVTLVTLTEPDSIANGFDQETLAGQWKDVFERSLSESLWGASFDRVFPWARWSGALVALGVGVLGVGLCTRALAHLRRIGGSCTRAMRELKVAVSEGDQDLQLRRLQRLETRLRRSTIGLKILQVVRIAVAVMAVTIILFTFAETRLAAMALLQQSAGIPLIWVGVILLEGLLIWAVMRRLNRWAEKAQLADPTSHRPQIRLETNARVIRGGIVVGTTLLGVYLTVLLFGINPEVLAGAGIVAVAVGFLARGLVEDLIGGVRILATDRFAIGDSIAVAGHSGLVESMNLVQTQLRGGQGEVITIPNGMIQVSENRSKEWSRVDFEIDIAWGSDVERACALLEQVASELAGDPVWGSQILDQPFLLGVERLDQSGVRLKLWIRTLPLKQWGVAREFRRRLKRVFDEAGIEPGIPQHVLRHP